MKNLFFVSLSLFLAVTCSAETITVSPNGSGDFDNIQEAIDASSNGDTVLVADGTYTGNGNRDIDFKGKAITVRSENGPEDCIIDCNGTEDEPHRGFYFHRGENMNSVVNGLTITNGYVTNNYGGGIYCKGSSPMISNCIISNNTAYSNQAGQMAYGGGMDNAFGSNPVITNCTFRGNLGGWGGGLCNRIDSIPKVINCSFSSNTAQHLGGGIFNTIRCNFTLKNCTLSNNSASMGGGIWNYGSNMKLVNCIVWSNDNGEIKDYDDEIHLLRVSYSDVKGGWFGNGNIDADPCFVDSVNDDYHLLEGSSCIDAGNPNYAAEANEVDLGGNPRVIGGRIDMGAYEFSPSKWYVDTDATGNNDGTSWADAFNFLQDALAVALNDNEIFVAQGTYRPDEDTDNPDGSGDRESTFQLKNGVVIIGGYAGYGEPNSNVRDANEYETILNGDLNGDDEVSGEFDLSDEPTRGENSFHVITGSGTNETAILDGFTITGGNANFVRIEVNGGGMYNYRGSPTVTNCTFAGNSAKLGGGGMYNYRSSPTVTNCMFRANSTNYVGFMKNYESSSPAVTNSMLSRNSAGGSDGYSSSSLTITLQTPSWGFGGGMRNDSNSSPTVRNCTFSGNSAGTDGGGMYSYENCNPTVTNCTFSGNSAGTDGGGMYSFGNCNPTVTNCTFSGNSAKWYGGGMYNRWYCIPAVTNCTFKGNSAGNGGGMYNNYSIQIQAVTNCVFSGNSARWGGGGMYNDDCSLVVTNCVFSGNSARWGGGGMYNDYSSPAVTNCVFSGNSTIYDGGGGMYNVWYCIPTVTNCTFNGNSAERRGGGMYNGSESSAKITNSIFWGNGDEIYDENKSSSVVIRSCIEGRRFGAKRGNIRVNPQFVNANGPDGVIGTEDDDLRLSFGSRCIDAGTNDPLGGLSLTDIEGTNRMLDGDYDGKVIVDIGAYEYVLKPLSVVKCKVKAGKAKKWEAVRGEAGFIGRDSIRVSGKILISDDDIANGSSVHVRIYSDNNDYQVIAVDQIKIMEGKYRYKDKVKFFKIDINKQDFSLSAKNVDLTGLGCPLSVEIEIGDYIRVGQVDERIVNGKKKPIPIQLMNGYAYKLRIDKVKVKRRKKPSTDTLKVKGAFAFERRGEEIGDLVMNLGGQEFLIAGGKFLYKGNTVGCKDIDIGNGIASCKFDRVKCTFAITIKKADIEAGPGEVDFSITTDIFDESVKVDLN